MFNYLSFKSVFANSILTFGVFLTLGSFLSSKRTGKTKAAASLRNLGRGLTSSEPLQAAASIVITLGGWMIVRVLNQPIRIHIVWPEPLSSQNDYQTVYSRHLSLNTGWKTPEEGGILSHNWESVNIVVKANKAGRVCSSTTKTHTESADREKYLTHVEMYQVAVDHIVTFFYRLSIL